MFRNYLKITTRNLIRNKGYTFINITGLAVGICCCLLIFMYVYDEINFDRFHEHYNELYRVILKGRFANEDLEIATSPAPMAFTLIRELPEVVQATRINQTGKFQIRRGDQMFDEGGVLFVDSTFFDVFSFVLIQGDSRNCLVEPHTLVLTQEMTEKYFGDENPMNQSMIMEDGTPYKVTGVVENPPNNSHIKFDFLFSLSSIEYSRNDMWVSNNYQTYIRIALNSDIEALSEKFIDLVYRYAGPQLQAATGVTLEEFEKAGNSYGFYLEPMKNVYMRSRVGNDLGPMGNISYVYIFSVIAIFILAIACINFINLSTAKSANRAKEVGIRKTVGSFRRDLIRQFLMESILMTFLAILIAVLLVKLAMPLFNDLTTKELSFTILNGSVIAALILMAIVVGVIAGSYPAFYLSAFQPVDVLKGNVIHGTSSGKLRSGLVVLQFAISIALIIGTLIVKQQLFFMQNKDLGFNKEQLLIVTRADVIGDDFNAFKNELKQNSNVMNATFSTAIPGHTNNINAHSIEDAPPGESSVMVSVWTDADFADTYQLRINHGRFLSDEISTDSTACVINEWAVGVMNWDSESGKRLIQMGPTLEQSEYHDIVGVVEDVHMMSLHEPMRAIVFYNAPGAHNYLSIRIRPENIKETVAFIEETWKKFVPDKTFEHYFYDDHYDEFYRAELRTGQVFSIFAGLAIMIACLGLFGLASFMAERKTKEIGVRKVLGASVAGITTLLIREFTKWVIIANVIAWPAAYFLMKNWLQDYVYRISMGWWVFLLSSVIALIIAVLTVSFHAVKAAISDPAKSLRYE